MMSDEEKKTALGRPERLFQNLIAVNGLKKSILFSKLRNTFYTTFGVVRCVFENFRVLKKPVPRNLKNWKNIDL